MVHPNPPPPLLLPLSDSPGKRFSEGKTTCERKACLFSRHHHHRSRIAFPSSSDRDMQRSSPVTTAGSSTQAPRALSELGQVSQEKHYKKDRQCSSRKKKTLLLLAPSHRQRRPSRGVGVFIRPLLPSPACRSRKDYKQRDTPPPQDLLDGTSQPSSVGRSFRPAVRKYLLRSAKRQILNQVFWLLLHPPLASRPCHRVSVVFPLGGWRAPEGWFRVLVLVRGGAILSTYRADS